MFPNIDPSVCALVLDFTSGSFSVAVDVLLGGEILREILTCFSERKLTGMMASIDVDSVSAVSCAVAYYKRPHIDMQRPVSVTYSGTPAVDAGGPKRQFFTDVLHSLKSSYNLFEGSGNRLLPVYSASVVSSGLFKVLGQVIVHSVLQEGPGFPFLAPFIYKCVCGVAHEEAIEDVNLSDLPEPVADLIEKVHYFTLSEILA